MKARRRIYTIGHSNRDIEEFISILKHYGIEFIIDVRRWPTSKKYHWFSRELLEKVLNDHGIGYSWLGDLLGGYRKEGYQNYMRTSEYQAGIKRLLAIASKSETAIMCAEKFWFKCHRRFIADTLKEMEWEIIHIIDKKRAYVQLPV